MSIKVGVAINKLLLKREQLKELVGDKIYPISSTHSVKAPFVVYRRSGFTPLRTKDRWSVENEIDLDVVVVSDGYDEGLSIAEQVIQALDNKKYNGDECTIESLQLVQAQEDFIEDVYLQVLSFKIKTV